MTKTKSETYSEFDCDYRNVIKALLICIAVIVTPISLRACGEYCEKHQKEWNEEHNRKRMVKILKTGLIYYEKTISNFTFFKNCCFIFNDKNC